MNKIDIDVHASGPMTDGSGGRMLRRTNDDIERGVAQHAEALVRARLPHVLRNPTGRYESTIHTVMGADPYVDGEGTVYGRWLEGTSRRNASTRFKGYATFRLVGQRTDNDAGGIAERHLDILARRL